MSRVSFALALLLAVPPLAVWADGTAPPPPVKVLEADAGKITLTTGHPALAQRLFLMNQTDKPQKVTLAVSDLRGSGGRTVQLELAPPSPLSLTPYQVQAVELKGQFTEVAGLTGLLTLQIDGVAQPQQYVLVVKRERGAQQIDIDAQPDPAAYRWWPLGTTATVRLRLTETTGEVAAYQWPDLQSLLVNVSDTYKPGAGYTRTRLLAEDGTELPRANDETVAPPQALAPWGALGLRLQIEGLRGTGKYEGTVRVATPNGPQTKSFTLFLKDCWLYAALVILAGVWASYWLRRWITVGRPQALAEYQIGLLLQRVQLEIPDVTSGVRRALEAALQELHRTTLLEPGTDIKANLQTVTEQLENYLIVEAIIVLRSQLEDLVLDKTQQDAIRQRLDLLDQRVQEGKLRALTNEAGKNALVDEARSIRQELLTAAGQALERAAAALTKNIEAERAALAAGPLSAADQKVLAAGLTKATSHLGTATRKLQESRAAAGQAAADLLQQGWQEYEAASQSYLDASVERFRQELAASVPPLGIEAEAWQSLLKELHAALPADATSVQFADARRRYIAAVLGGIEQQAGKSAQEAGAIAGQGQTVVSLQAVAAVAAAARKKLAGGEEVSEADVATLRADYDSAMALLPTARDLKIGAEKERAEEIVSRAAAPQLGGNPTDLVGVPQLPRDIAPVRTPDAVVGDIRRHDGAVAWIVSAVSVLVGLRVLWATSPAFGSLIDYIGAFLWGFGLHELNKITMPEGLTKLGLVLPKGKDGG